MCALFTDDDVGKSVENERGVRVGVVDSVQGEVAHVRPDPAVVESVKSSLGWEGGGTETYPLEAAAVVEITDETVRLEGELQEPNGTSGREEGSPPIEPGAEESDPETGTDRGPEVDPSALAEQSPEVEVDLEEADRRTDAEVAPDDDHTRTDAEIEPDDATRRDDAEIDPDDV